MPKTGPNPCATCGSASKYTCPGCDMRSCSVGCVRTHKLATGCGGVRDKTKYVSMRAFGDATLVSDFAFLEDAARIADNAARDLTTSGLGGPGENGDKEKSRFHPVAGPKLSARETHLLRNCKSRRIAIRFMPKGMSRHDTNRSFFHHK
ncbi:hypothetical protein BC830DRAFT_1069722 [Chytriomyces sp. MP71]|nr:hypothetical protein BC830DRAFT_1069722 [Chytriomyces sp. MP71]